MKHRSATNDSVCESAATPFSSRYAGTALPSMYPRPYWPRTVRAPTSRSEIGRSAQHGDVLHGLLAEVVVDAKHLILAEDLMHDPGELHRRRQVATERLLHDDARPARATQLVLADGAHDRRVGLRRRGEVEEAIAVRASLDVDAVQRRAERVVARVVRRPDEAYVARERAPHLL